jgi:hypothetical protein
MTHHKKLDEITSGDTAVPRELVMEKLYLQTEKKSEGIRKLVSYSGQGRST